MDSIGVNEGTGSPYAIHTRPPPFWPARIDLWFVQLEQHFVTLNLTRENLKFATLVAQLDTRALEEIEDILIDQPAEGSYSKAKALLIKRMSASDSERIRKLLEAEQLGDRTPTQFWRHLKSLAGNCADNKILLEIWKNRLHPQTQRILKCMPDDDISKLAEVADEIHAVPSEKGMIAAASTSTAASSSPSTSLEGTALILEEIKKMKLEISELYARNERPANRPRKRARSRSRSRSTTRNENLCWYHDRFGSKAVKCTSPCNWSSTGNGQGR